MATGWDEKVERIWEAWATKPTSGEPLVAASTAGPHDWSTKLESLGVSRFPVAGATTSEPEANTGELRWPTAEELQSLRNWRRG